MTDDSKRFEELKRFNAPDYGTAGQIISQWRHGLPTNTTPGLANGVDMFNAVTKLVEEHYSPKRVDDGKTGRRLAKIIYAERLNTIDIVDPIFSILNAGADVPPTIMCVYAAVAGGTSSMLPLPKSLFGGDSGVDFTRIYRFPRFYSIDTSLLDGTWIGQDCWVEYLDKDTHAYGFFLGMTNRVSSMTERGPSEPLGNKFGKAGTKTSDLSGQCSSADNGVWNRDPSQGREAPAFFSKKKITVKCSIEATGIKGTGINWTTLREDVAPHFEKLNNALNEFGGAIGPLAGGTRNLKSSQKTAPSKAPMSLHYLGRAVDLSMGNSSLGTRRPLSGTGTGKKQPPGFILTLNPNDARRWIVWARVVDKTAPRASEVPTKTLNAVVGWNKDVPGQSMKRIWKTKEVTGQFINFTALAKQYGWDSIKGRSYFMTPRAGAKKNCTRFDSAWRCMRGAEWWHFQYTSGLYEGETTYGDEMLCYWDESQLISEYAGWERVKNITYRRGWS